MEERKLYCFEDHLISTCAICPSFSFMFFSFPAWFCPSRRANEYATDVDDYSSSISVNHSSD
jgi:hypothetical protein